MNGTIAKISLVGISIVFSFGMAELALRIIKRGADDPEKFWRNERSRSGGVPEGSEIRILGIGESTMLGEPYDPKICIPALVAHYLDRALAPATVTWEVAARKGATIKMLRQDIANALARDPSAAILLAGHNEFLGAFSHDQACAAGDAGIPYRVGRFSLLYRTLHDASQRRRMSTLPVHTERDLFDAPIVCQRQWDEVIETYAREVMSLARHCRARRIPLVLVFPAGNEADFGPNRSVYRSRESSRQRFAESYLMGRRALSSGKLNDALQHFELAREIDPRFAEVRFRAGQALAAMGRLREARTEHHIAKEEDAFPWRALDAQKSALKSAAEREGAVFLDGEELLRSVSPSGLLDAHLFHDMHHPTLQGYNTISIAIAQAIAALPSFSKQNPRTIVPSSEEALAREFSFSNGDWFALLNSRAAWLDRVSEVRFDPSDRLILLLDQIEGMKELDAAYYRKYVDVDGYPHEGLETSARKRLEEAAADWGGVGEEYGGHGPRASMFRMWSGFGSRDVQPVHISGVPSTIRHADLICADGKDAGGAPLRSQGTDYSSGFTTALNHYLLAEVAFQLDSAYTRFTARVTIADNGTRDSGVFCRVIGDGRTLYESPPIRWNEPPIALDVDVRGVHELRLYCNSLTQTGDFNDLLWLDPELQLH